MEKNFEYYAELVKQYQVSHQEKHQAFAEKYGFRIEETWNLNTEMICWLLPRLAYLKQFTSAIPNSVFLFINDSSVCVNWNTTVRVFRAMKTKSASTGKLQCRKCLTVLNSM